MQDEFKKAFEIADRDLRNCFEDGGIVASVDHFNDFWARDSFYASWGLLALGETEKVRSNLELFLEYQKNDGQIPRRIDRFYVGLEYLGIKIPRKRIRPTFFGAHISPALDPNLLFIIGCGKYLETAKDIDFIRTNFEKIEKAWQWLKKFEKGGLLEEGKFANWMDVIVKTGAVLYTNVLYLEAVRSMAEMGRNLGKDDRAEEWDKQFEELKKIIDERFWLGEYYADWIAGRKKFKYLSTDGNVLAMLFGLSDQKKSESIMKKIKEYGLDDIPLKTNHPRYPWQRVALRMYPLGAWGYQNEYAAWLWLGCVYAVSLKKNGFLDESAEIFKKVSRKIEELGGVYEIYSPDGRPFSGWLWKSAASFAWSSGMYLWMKKELEK